MKNYTVTFGSGDPRGFTGLAPTFLSFYNLATGTTNTPPSIAETITGKTGIYTFQYGVTQPISFLLDAATTSPGANGRYVTGQIDPADRADEYGNTLIAYGLSLLATGSSLMPLLGTPTDSVGTTAANPTTVLGFLRRALEFAEGQQSYTKATGVLTTSTRAATLLSSRTISDSSSTTTKA